MFNPVERTASEVGSRFRSLRAQWRDETAHLSDPVDICVHPAYQHIIGLGPAAVPHIIDDITTYGAAHWPWALTAITGNTMTGPDVVSTCYAWVSWWNNNQPDAPADFMSQLAAGNLSESGIDDWVDTWHDTATGDVPLITHLGMTWPEYKRWVTKSQTPQALLDERHIRGGDHLYADFEMEHSPQHLNQLREPAVTAAVEPLRENHPDTVSQATSFTEQSS